MPDYPDYDDLLILWRKAKAQLEKERKQFAEYVERAEADALRALLRQAQDDVAAKDAEIKEMKDALRKPDGP